MRKTKIVCTLGPATDKGNVLEEIVLAGMDVARFNFSHSTHEDHKERLLKLTEIRERCNRPVAALLDTKGPEVRLKEFEQGKVDLVKGQHFTLTTRDVTGTNEIVSITYQELPQDVEVGTAILIDDGLVEMKVIEKTDTDIICEVKNDGQLSNKKGVNVPSASLSMPYLSDKDKSDIIFGIENGFDFIAASFTRTAEDILEIRQILENHHCRNINIIAKIENKQGMQNIDSILAVSDGVMVARGDMGVEVALEELPIIQKQLIKQCYKMGKVVITATQMLDSMMKNPRPTRAEVTDVANAIYDGTSAIMLSGETAAGLYPVEAVRTMACIAERTEQDINYRDRFRKRDPQEKTGITEAISHATVMTAQDLEAVAIVTVTKSGRTARMVSKYRPACPIIGCSTEARVCRQMNLSWGVIPILLEERQDTFDLFNHAVQETKKAGYLKNGDLAVLTAGVPLGISGTTNLLKVERVSD